MGCCVCKGDVSEPLSKGHLRLQSKSQLKESPLEKPCVGSASQKGAEDSLKKEFLPSQSTQVISEHQDTLPLNNSAVSNCGRIAHQQTESPVQSVVNKTVDKDHRTLSTCRLKRDAKVTDAYDLTNDILGTGISGAVCLTTHKDTKRQYAIKTLSLKGVGSKKAAMLHNEVSIYLQLDHPNIAKLIEVYETEEAIYLVMEWCTGGELYHRLAQRKKYTERDAAHVTQQMLSAINYCHKNHICHRDLKLENWIYADPSPDAPVKLIDFGFSRIFNPGIPMTAMHGTVYYVSPEVMDGCYKEKCDIWSIGVIVYMLLSGSPPFCGRSDHEILLRIRKGVLKFNGPRWEGISEDAQSFIRSLLQKDPDLRPSAEEALAHPWLRNDTPAANIDVTVLKSMQEFALCNILKRAALNVVALSMTFKELAELEAAFRALDRNKEGSISLKDLALVLTEKLNISSSELNKIFSRIIQTGTEEIHYTEFIASTLQARFVKDETLIAEAFKRFDVDHRQKISLQNLRAVLGDVYNGTPVEDIISLCDTNKDGYIDFDEFSNALTSNEIALHEEAMHSDEKSQGEFVRTTPQASQKRESALSTLHSMRKATYFEADAERSTK